MSDIMHPLDRLLQDNVKLEWSAACKSSFEKIEEETKSNKVLCHLDSSLPVVLATDASPYGIGMTLSHRFPDDTERH